eukprot:s1616_g9.t1
MGVAGCQLIPAMVLTHRNLNGEAETKSLNETTLQCLRVHLGLPTRTIPKFLANCGQRSWAATVYPCSDEHWRNIGVNSAPRATAAFEFMPDLKLLRRRLDLCTIDDAMAGLNRSLLPLVWRPRCPLRPQVDIFGRALPSLEGDEDDDHLDARKHFVVKVFCMYSGQDPSHPWTNKQQEAGGNPAPPLPWPWPGSADYKDCSDQWVSRAEESQ